MEKYRLTVPKPGFKFIFRGKEVKSPITFLALSKSELDLIEAQVRKSSAKYTIEVEPGTAKKNRLENSNEENNYPPRV